MLDFYDEIKHALRPATAQDIEYAYQMILGRPPEDQAVVDEFLAHNYTLAELREAFIYSNEFAQIIKAGIPKPDSISAILTDDRYEPQTIEYLGTKDEMRAIMAHIEKVWKRYGQEGEAFWSVLTQNKYMGRQLTEDLKREFYETGAENLDGIKVALRRCGQLDSLTRGHCLEYGCGVGRITAHLAGWFESVVGVDISEAHLEQAQDFFKKSGIDNAVLRKITRLEELATYETFDFIYTIIVLQHNPPPIMYSLLKAFFNLLKPGGILMFQIPVRIIGYQFIIKDYLARMESEREMETHALPQNVILKTASEHGCYPLEIQCDRSLGLQNMVSQMFTFMKKKHGGFPD